METGSRNTVIMLLSTPTHLRYQSSEKHVEIDRPASVPPASANPDCDRVYQVEHEPVRKHSFENHLSVKRQRSPPWQKQLDQSPAMAFSMGNGYTLYKSKEKLNMHVKMDTVLEAPALEITTHHHQRKKTGLDPAIEALIHQLQEQINDLQYFLEEERLNHRDTVRNAEEAMRRKVEELLRQQDNIVRQLEADHAHDLDLLREEQLKALQEQKEEADARVAKMKSEIEFLQGAFESYKSTLHQEMNDDFNKKIEKLKSDQEEDTDKQLQQLKQRMIMERNAEKSAISKENQKQMQLLSRDHKKELDALIRRFASASQDLEKLKAIEKEFAELKEEHKQLYQENAKVRDQLKMATLELSDAKIKILEFEENFQDKVQQVDDKYKEQIHGLMSQNTELRRVYMKKCEELVEEKNVTQKTIDTKVESAKDVMQAIINTRRRANVSMAAAGPEWDNVRKAPKDRPSSAPMTQTETKLALLSAGEADKTDRTISRANTLVL
ncbi:involucrin-like isoform X2 [Lineus longissimus]|uniref:involucrin-like isoform X2 n=1 Tax=Lineus longissimus TaxID=88925 RepID=UPI002B4C32C8